MKPNLIAIAVDKGMFPPAAFLAERLASLNPRGDVDIAILSDAKDEIETARQFGVPADDRQQVVLLAIVQGLEHAVVKYETRVLVVQVRSQDGQVEGDTKQFAIGMPEVGAGRLA